jgi:3-oxoacyl-[acyl-carrier-protein] synthase-3
MNKDQLNIGLASWGLYLPENYISAEELSPLIRIPTEIIKEKMGFCRKPLGGPDDHSVAMGIKAAKQCLEKNNTDPASIDLIIWAGEDYKEYVCWTAAIAVQEAIGAKNAWAFDSALRCAGTPLSLKLAKDLMFANPELNTVLIAGGNTNCYLIDYRRPEQSFMFDMAPSGLAMLLKRDWPENRILESHIITESSMCNDVMSLKGGTKNPLTEEDVRNEGWRINVTDPEGMKQRLGEKSLPAFTGAVRGALKRSGLTTQDVSWVCPVHINPKSHNAILADLGLTADHGAYLYDYGHCGHGDQLIGLEMGLSQGKVKDGSVVVFLGAGTGYAFSATAIRWGRTA